MAIPSGTQLGPYTVLAPLGAGGMGEVYRARDKKLDRDVAVKVLPESVASDPDSLGRFEREAKAVAALSHPNILSIFDFGTHDGISYAVMELLEGETLRGRLDAGPIPQKQAVDYALQVAKGLSAAHEKGIVHRDLKPENLFVSKDGHLKILDFGLAKRTGQGKTDDETSSPTQSKHTEPGVVMGTVGYMSPEQVRGLAVDHRSDVFSLGAILYELLSGKKAFKRDTAADTMSAILKEEPPELSDSGRNISPALDRVIKHCLEKDRNNRFQSARDIVFVLSETSGQAMPSGAQGTAASQVAVRRRQWTRPALAGAVILGLSAGAIWWVAHRRGSVRASRGQITLAVLPFQNLSADASTDYLRLALADEVATTLSYVSTLAIRPFASSRKYAKPDVDPQTAGRELQVADVLAGHFLKEGDRLQVTLEVVDTESNRLLWRDTSTAAANDLIGLKEQISQRLRQGLFPLLGATAGAAQAATRPRSQEAYDLYLRATAMGRDPLPNKEAILLLEKSVGLDQAYAPAWNELGHRLNFDSSYGDGGAAARRRSREALEHALSLDPNFSIAAGNLAIDQVEGGELSGACARAADLVRRRPESADAHFTLGYVLRYAGLLEESARECDAALAADPRSRDFRSCYITFMQLRRHDRARDFLRLDAGSEWAQNGEADLLVREGRYDPAVAKQKGRQVAQLDVSSLLLKSGPQAERDRLAERVEARFGATRDPEPKYFGAGILAAAGYPQGALRLLGKAVEGNYLCSPAMDNDPLFDGLRRDPEFAAIRAEAMRKQKAFLERRAR
jgi:TolB-like protein